LHHEENFYQRALHRLRSGEPVFGVLQAIPSATLTELAVWSGFDFVILDCEHGIVDEQAHLASLQVISGSNAFGVVRIRPGDLHAVGRYLEFGAAGIVLPDVQTAEEAAAFVSAATYGPSGTRSSTGTGTRASRYGLPAPAPEPPLLLALIEGARAAQNIEEIASTPGLSGVLIGSHDLSADLGDAGNYSTSRYHETFEQIERAAQRAGLILGSGVHPGFPMQRLLDAGHRFMVSSVDFLALRDGFRVHLDNAKNKSASVPETLVSALR
jgi:4-hydroxy-2-oxoheptanedioate aldolase